MAVTHAFGEFNALIGLSFEIMTIWDKAMIVIDPMLPSLTVGLYGSITVYRPSPRR